VRQQETLRQAVVSVQSLQQWCRDHGPGL
jgi:hypothetical protein